jgi:hypothetical protein
VIRAWVTPRRFYDVDTGRFTFDYGSASGNTAFDYLDQVVDIGRRLMLNVEQCPQELMTIEAPQRCHDVLLAGIRAYKQRYPQLTYIELFNEPDKNWPLGPDDSRPMSADEYYRWYQIGYRIINEINAELRPKVPLQLGGPVTYTFDRAYLQRFLQRYHDDSDPAKRLDFISYHQYKARENPASVAKEKATVVQWLAKLALNRATPVFVTEFGVFPGANEGTSFAADQLTQAAAMATLSYYYTEGGTDMAMHWVFDHPTNDRKSMFVDDTDGAVTPYYNLVAMQRMLGTTRLAARCDALTAEGIGVNALATKDAKRVAVLVTNYQWTTGTAAHMVELSVDGLPESLRSQPLRLDRYLIDAKTSNYAADPQHSGLQRVQQITVPAGASATVAFPLAPNAISLVVLSAKN